ncbi:acyl carrier protein [Streptomyces sp. NPDC085929]|uniref:acyl carrier protein n=1 Tax=Streptomyces sp. NPDC085929 TaxID=3365739 RepID=UPI0037CCFFAC
MTFDIGPRHIAAWLTGHLAALLEVPAEAIDPHTPLDALGITSMEEVMITADLETRYDLVLPLTDVRRHPTIDDLSAYVSLRLTEPAPSAGPSPFPGEGF